MFLTLMQVTIKNFFFLCPCTESESEIYIKIAIAMHWFHRIAQIFDYCWFLSTTHWSISWMRDVTLDRRNLAMVFPSDEVSSTSLGWAEQLSSSKTALELRSFSFSFLWHVGQNAHETTFWILQYPSRHFSDFGKQQVAELCQDSWDFLICQ